MSIREINSKPYSVKAYLQRMKSFGHLISSLSKRELKIKYARTLLGVGWVIVQPLVWVIIFTVFFNYLIKINTGNVPYIQFVLSGLVLWYVFTNILGKCSIALIESSELINKVSFPRIILLIAKSFPVIIEGLVLYAVMLCIIIIHQKTVSIQHFLSFFCFLQVLIWSYSLAILFSIAIVRFRDFVHIVPFIMNFGIWLTPVFYPVSIIPGEYQNLLKYTNPIAHAMENFRAMLFNGGGVSFDSVIIFGISLIILYTFFVFFIKFEKHIVERI